MALNKIPFAYGVIHDWNGGDNRVCFLSKASAVDYAVRMHGVWFPLYKEEVCTVKPSDVSSESAEPVGVAVPVSGPLVQINEPDPYATVSSQCQNQTTSSSASAVFADAALIDLYS